MTVSDVLPTFAVLARFRVPGDDGVAAVRSVVTQLTAAQEPFHEVDVERIDDDAVLVVARFVLVSVDGHTAVVGLSETLAEAGIAADEVWVDRQVA